MYESERKSTNPEFELPVSISVTLPAHGKDMIDSLQNMRMHYEMLPFPFSVISAIRKNYFSRKILYLFSFHIHLIEHWTVDDAGVNMTPKMFKVDLTK